DHMTVAVEVSFVCSLTSSMPAVDTGTIAVMVVVGSAAKFFQVMILKALVVVTG
ncbi:hypothetical protein Droror1_Dr00017965, partial [Drosera rotundifolia]